MFDNVRVNFDGGIGDINGRAWTIWILPTLQIEKYRLAESKGITLYASWIVFSAEIDFSWR